MAQEPPGLKPVRPGNVRAWHEADIGNLESIKQKGIIGSEGTNFGERPGERQVFGQLEERPAPVGRVKIPFQAPEENITGRGTAGSSAVSFRGDIPPEDLYSGVPRGGEALNAFSNILMLADAPTPSGRSSLGSAAQDWLTQRGVLPTDFRLGPGGDLMQRIQNGGPQVPRPYGADPGWGTGVIPQGSLMQYALAQSMGRPTQARGTSLAAPRGRRTR
jgi:hypothetical protein